MCASSGCHVSKMTRGRLPRPGLAGPAVVLEPAGHGRRARGAARPGRRARPHEPARWHRGPGEGAWALALTGRRRQAECTLRVVSGVVR